MRVVAASHWAFGRDRELLRGFWAALEASEAHLHDLRGDPDLNRTSLWVSGEPTTLLALLVDLADLALPRIDLGRHTGTHPRTGALDACSLMLDRPTDTDLEKAHALAEQVAAGLAARHRLPVLLSDKTARREESLALGIREGGFGSLLERPLEPDFGPPLAHSRLGVALVGVRDLTLEFQLDVQAPNGGFLDTLVREAARLREDGDERFLGVEVAVLQLPSRSRGRLHFQLTLPDLATADPLVEWAIDRCGRAGLRAQPPELVGVIRARDLPGAERLQVRDGQLLEPRT